MAQFKKRFAEQSEDDLRNEMSMLQSGVDQAHSTCKMFKAFSTQHTYPVAAGHCGEAWPSNQAQPCFAAKNSGQPPTKRACPETKLPASKTVLHADCRAMPASNQSLPLLNSVAMDSGADGHRDDSQQPPPRWHEYMQLREELDDT
jgi:hypothetical protein